MEMNFDDERRRGRSTCFDLCGVWKFHLFLPHSLSTQLFQSCGSLSARDTSSTGVDDSMKRGKVIVEDKLASSKMDKLVSIYPAGSVPLLLLPDGPVQPLHMDGL